jgi:hypothetical protein
MRPATIVRVSTEGPFTIAVLLEIFWRTPALVVLEQAPGHVS